MPGPMLVDMPTLDPGPPIRSPTASSPKRCGATASRSRPTDFKYTWEQIVNGKDIYDTDRLRRHREHRHDRPEDRRRHVLEPFAGWTRPVRRLLLRAPEPPPRGQEPQQGDEGRLHVLRRAVEARGGKSGWKKGESVTLVPNDAVLGHEADDPEGDLPVHRRERGRAPGGEDRPGGRGLPAADRRRGRSGRRVAEPVLRHQLRQQFEAFWLNTDKFPLDSQAVRQAIAYAIDRQAIVDAGPAAGDQRGRVLQSFIVPTFPNFYEPTFEQYTPDLQVDQLMTGDGWEKNGDGIWEKDGKSASFEINRPRATSAVSYRAALAEPARAGRLRARPSRTSTPTSCSAIGSRRGSSPASLFASVGTPDPGLCLHLLHRRTSRRRRTTSAGQNSTRTQRPGDRRDVVSRRHDARRCQRGSLAAKTGPGRARRLRREHPARPVADDLHLRQRHASADGSRTTRDGSVLHDERVES